MSSLITSIFSNQIAKQLDGSENQFLNAIISLNNSIDRLYDAIPKLKPVLKSNGNNLSSNVAADVLILPGRKVPLGYVMSVEDFNLTFSTVAGTVKIVVLNPNGEIRNEVLRGITGNTNGIGKPTLEEGESLAVMGQTAGNGTFGVYCSGVLQKVSNE